MPHKRIPLLVSCVLIFALTACSARRIPLSSGGPGTVKYSEGKVALTVLDGNGNPLMADKGAISVASGANLSIRYDAKDAKSCAFFINNSEVLSLRGPTKGNYNWNNFTESSVVKVECATAGDKISEVVTINAVSSTPSNITVTIAALNESAQPQQGIVPFPFGYQTIIRWESNAESCTIYQPNGEPLLTSAPSGTANTGVLTSDQTWTIMCENVGAFVTIDVIPPPPPAPSITSFTINNLVANIQVNANTDVVVRWESSNTEECAIANSLNQVIKGGPNNTMGLVIRPAQTGDTITLQCLGLNGEPTNPLTRQIAIAAAVPSAWIKVNGTRSSVSIPYGSQPSLEWAAVDLQVANSCSILRGDSPSAGTVVSYANTGGPSAQPALTKAKEYFSIRCDNGAVSDFVEVTSQAPTDHVVFVTSSTQNGNMGGADGADTICRNLATAANLRADRPWKAILSSSVAAKDRITLFGGEVKDTLGRVISINGSLWNGVTRVIDRDENGNGVSHAGEVLEEQDVWTGTNNDGSRHNQRCKEWTSSSKSEDGRAGSSQIKGVWLNEDNEECNLGKRLYCISQ